VPSRTVSSIGGLIERDRERERCLEVGIASDVVEAFVEEDEGDIIDSVEVVDALDVLRPRWYMLRPVLDPAELNDGEMLRSRNCVLV
jgi:hypothetical protein